MADAKTIAFFLKLVESKKCYEKTNQRGYQSGSI